MVWCKIRMRLLQSPSSLTSKNASNGLLLVSGLAYVPFCCTRRQSAYGVLITLQAFLGVRCTRRGENFFYQAHYPRFCAQTNKSSLDFAWQNRQGIFKLNQSFKIKCP